MTRSEAKIHEIDYSLEFWPRLGFGFHVIEARAARNVGQRSLSRIRCRCAGSRGACSRARSAQSARSEVDGARCARRRRQLAVFMVQPRLTGSACIP